MTANSAFLPTPRLLKLLALALTALLLASCATQKVSPTAPDQSPTRLTTWRIEGKLGFRSPEKNGSAWINWSQDNNNYLMQLNGPFGAAATRISGDHNHAILSQSGREDVSASSGEELTAWLFGWPLPVEQMRYWVKGIAAPSPKPQSIVTTPEKLLSSLTQKGWHLVYSDYRQEGDWVLPGKIQGSQGDYSFTLVVKKWGVM